MRLKTPLFVKLTLQEGGRHVYVAADWIQVIAPSDEGCRVCFKDSPDAATEVRESVADIFDQFRNPFKQIPSNHPPPPVEESYVLKRS